MGVQDAPAMSSHLMNRVIVCVVALPALTSLAPGQPGTVLSHQKISDTEGGFNGIRDNGFSFAVASPGDLDADGVGNLAVRASGDDDGGAVWVLFLDGPDCPWDCTQTGDGVVGMSDMALLLAQWGSPGTCDIDGGGVGITDLLELLGAWGPCPQTGACCALEGLCQSLTLNQCEAIDGCFQGAGTSCEDVTCPDRTCSVPCPDGGCFVECPCGQTATCFCDGLYSFCMCD